MIDPAAPAATDWDRKRRLVALAHVALQAVVLLAVLVVANLLARKFPKRVDFTSRRSFGLSALTEEALRTLEPSLVVWVNPSQYDVGASGDKSVPNALLRMLELLEEFKHRAPKVRYYVMNPALGPQSIPETELFYRNWNTVHPSTLYLLAEFPPESGRPANKKMVGFQELYDGNAMTGEITSFRGEAVLVQAIRELSGGRKRVVFQTEGHQEIVTEDRRALGYLTQYLSKNEGVEIQRLSTSDVKAIPTHGDAVMILGPAQPFTEYEVALLREYLERGGSLLVALRPKVRTGLEPLLAEYGIKPGEGIVHDGVEYAPPYKTALLVRDFNVHEINRSRIAMANVSLLVPDAMPLLPVEKPPRDVTVTPLARSGPQSWEETGATGPDANPGFDPVNERPGPLPLVVAAEKAASKSQDPERKKAKLVVWGSVTPFTNSVLFVRGFEQTLQVEYVANNFRWLASREVLGIQPTQVSVKPLELSAGALKRLNLVIQWGFPSFGVLLGVVAWFVRRK
jgi:hypothetical protein